MKSGRLKGQAELILMNKPYQVMCQFTDEKGRLCLKDFLQLPGFYPAGRLDYDSEGLLILTNNGRLQARITQPNQKMWKTYWVEVEGLMSQEAVVQLSQGLILKDGPTRAAKVSLEQPPSWLWRRDPPVRFRKNIPTSWARLSIHEGKNRQVRRMCAAVGFPVLRLIRTNVGEWSLQDLQPGQWIKLSGKKAF